MANHEFEQVANRVSDAIVDIANTELVLMSQSNRIDVFAILAGQLLALKFAGTTDHVAKGRRTRHAQGQTRSVGQALSPGRRLPRRNHRGRRSSISMPKKKLIEAETSRDRT